ncbi:hypothetical protein LUZ63_006919 [Rhynchospora breviuscula]|uniref:Pentatricopeptide repeat-containing protein n=1 Tax=Rhynchospora breviuscula TaxID=2022672 RepID=A0A9Q0CRG5_9POAL|nr:hypothetical protein LUZ63_006919 [Rhynchospora breviuscula]
MAMARSVRSLRNSKLLLSASAEAIRCASSPAEVVTRFNLRRRGLFPPDPFDSHVAVFTIKSISSSTSLRRSLTPLMHAYVLKTNLLSKEHVASILLKSYSLFSLADARALFDEILQRDLCIANTMISCFLRNGDFCSAQFLFDSSSIKDIVSWSAMIGGYMAKNRRDDAISLFRKLMLQRELKPNSGLLVTLLSEGAFVGSMKIVGTPVHAYAVKNVPKKEMYRVLGTTLIKMYEQAGNLKYAFSVFKQIPEKSVMHWTSMICSLAMYGHADEANSLLLQMRNSGIKPHAARYIKIFNACCHAGLTDMAQKCLTIMGQEIGFMRTVHHYGCLISLLGNDGRLDEAYGVIKSLEVQPNIVIWTSFLEACKKYKNFEMAKEGITKVLSIARPDQHGGVYNLVLDLYTLGGCWDEVKRIRQLINEQKVASIERLSKLLVKDICRKLLAT